ncbi:hypothetical protein JKY72_01555 [Candidatus Gracilibacteria bacterium]|nr:hypothetical protein [Candidatus Gracilibacteria bacterium]
MDKNHTALYNLEALAITFPNAIKEVFSKYGHLNLPVNGKNIAAMTIQYKEPFTGDLFHATRPFLNQSQPLLNYEGETTPDTKSGFHKAVNKLAGILFGVDKMVNPDTPKDETTEEDTEKSNFLGVPSWGWAVIGLVVTVSVVLFVYGRNKN